MKIIILRCDEYINACCFFSFSKKKYLKLKDRINIYSDYILRYNNLIQKVLEYHNGLVWNI